MTPHLERYLVGKYGKVDKWIITHWLKNTLLLYSQEIIGVYKPSYVSTAFAHIFTSYANDFTEITQSEFNAMVDDMYPINKPEEVDNSPQPPKTETVYDIANRLLDENHQLKMRVIELEHAERMRELTSKA